MRTIDIHEAKLAELIELVYAGEEVLLTDSNQPRIRMALVMEEKAPLKRPRKKLPAIKNGNEGLAEALFALPFEADDLKREDDAPRHIDF